MMLDVRLPGISGFEVLRIIKENYPYVEVIVISAMQGARHRDRGDAPRRLPLHVEGLRSRGRAHAGRQRQRAAGSEPSVMRLRAEVAEQNEREFVVGPEPHDARHRRSRAQGREAVGDRADSRRERHRQGAARADDSSRVRPPDAPFVAVNLAAIPKDLVESTLFGHEKGAFTGAIRQQLGKFELANGGTLFLDEIGDLRYELQAKLLRAHPGRARSSASAARIRSRPTSG